MGTMLPKGARVIIARMKRFEKKLEDISKKLEKVIVLQEPIDNSNVEAISDLSRCEAEHKKVIFSNLSDDEVSPFNTLDWDKEPSFDEYKGDEIGSELSDLDIEAIRDYSHREAIKLQKIRHNDGKVFDEFKENNFFLFEEGVGLDAKEGVGFNGLSVGQHNQTPFVSRFNEEGLFDLGPHIKDLSVDPFWVKFCVTYEAKINPMSSKVHLEHVMLSDSKIDVHFDSCGSARICGLLLDAVLQRRVSWSAFDCRVSCIGFIVPTVQIRV